jgi:PBSX family phage terminase large subunit
MSTTVITRPASSARRLAHRYKPRGGCRAALESRAPEVLLSGPAGTGKSRACLEKLNLAALKYPGMQGLIARKTAVSLGPSALKTWREYVIPELLQTQQVRFFGGNAELPPAYMYKNGSSVAIVGMDNPIKIMSTEFDMIYAQEAIELSENDWESFTIRLRNGRMPYQQLLADTNPDHPLHWLNVRCESGQTLKLESRHEDNPVLFDDQGKVTPAGEDYIFNKLEKLTGVRYLRYRKGLWVASDGIIYEHYDPAIHLVDRFEIPKDWTRYWVVDFGTTNPFVLQWWAEDPDGRLYLYREIYHTGRLLQDHAAAVKAQVLDDKGNWLEPRPRAIICDHDAQGRMILEKELGLATVAAKKDVLDGIQATEVRFKNAADGKPRIFILKDSLVERDRSLVDAKKPTCTAEEIPQYIWLPPRPGQPPKEEPRKENDHGCDAKRYMVAHRDLNKSGGRARMLNPNAVRRKYRTAP